MRGDRRDCLASARLMPRAPRAPASAARPNARRPRAIVTSRSFGANRYSERFVATEEAGTRPPRPPAPPSLLARAGRGRRSTSYRRLRPAWSVGFDAGKAEAVPRRRCITVELERPEARPPARERNTTEVAVKVDERGEPRLLPRPNARRATQTGARGPDRTSCRRQGETRRRGSRPACAPACAGSSGSSRCGSRGTRPSSNFRSERPGCLRAKRRASRPSASVRPQGAARRRRGPSHRVRAPRRGRQSRRLDPPARRRGRARRRVRAR